MPYEVYATGRWVGYRLLKHMIVLAPALAFTGYVTENKVLVLGLVLIVALLYCALIYGQLSKPLLSIADGNLVIVDLFYKGVVTLNCRDIEGFSLNGRRFLIAHKSGSININISGLSVYGLERLKAIQGVLQTEKEDF